MTVPDTGAGFPLAPVSGLQTSKNKAVGGLTKFWGTAGKTSELLYR